MPKKPTPKRAAGGFARAEKLSKKELSEIGRKAALSRWNKDVPKADYEGTLKFGDISFKCAVIEKPDGSAVRLISQTDFMDGMGMYYSGYIAKQHREKDAPAGVPMFLAQSALKPFVEANLEVLQFELVSYITEGGQLAKGIPAEIISKICKVWVEARKSGALGKAKRMLQIAENAAIIRDASPMSGWSPWLMKLPAIRTCALGRLAGNPERVSEQVFRCVVKTHPGRVLQADIPPQRVGMAGDENESVSSGWQHTTDLVYKRLAPGVQEELNHRNPKDDKGNRRSKHHQWLTDDIGHPALAQHLHAILGLMRASKTWEQFKTLANTAFPVMPSGVEIEQYLLGLAPGLPATSSDE